MSLSSELQPAVSHSDPIAPVIFGVTLILVAALIGRYTARHLNQPSVLGELLMGVVLGNLLYVFHYDLMVVLREGTAVMDIARHALAGISLTEAANVVLGDHYGPIFLEVLQGPRGGEYLQVAQAVDIFSRYGVIFLLFHVGLDTCIEELRAVGANSLKVATIGVVAPFALGFLLAWWLIPDGGHAEHMFLGATLCATSIGITARVLEDLGQSFSKESHIIVGAAVMDDVLGLVILAIATGVVVTGSVEFSEITRTITLAFFFIFSVILMGPTIIRWLIRLLRKLDVMEAKLFISFIFVMTVAWIANTVGLATIVGAFAAGLLLQDNQFNAWGDHRHHKYSIKELFAPLEAILVPVFFVLMGIQVKLETFLNWEVVILALGLIVIGIGGKVVAGLGVDKGYNRLAVGIGMMPRGEVGLVFASIGKSLGVMDTAMFSAVVLMVIVTTLLTPPVLKIVMGQGDPEAIPGPRRSRPCK
ncbi:MAG: cation:proton antiporter [Gammaproteobacteria bacterium]|nr:cation:proton antiporter [Gammaproteobacteria bacterium]